MLSTKEKLVFAIAQTLIILVCLLVVWNTFEEGLFAYHPLLTTIGTIAGYSEGVLAGRFIKSSYRNFFINLHGFLQGISVFCSLTGIGLMIWIKYDGEDVHFQSVHSILGLFTGVLTIVQFCLALYLRSISKNIRKYRAVAKAHYALGSILLALSHLNICLGMWVLMSEYKSDLVIAISALVTLLTGFVLASRRPAPTPEGSMKFE